MLKLIGLPLVAWLGFAILGFVVKGLFGLALVGAAFLVVAGGVGWAALRRRHRTVTR